MGSTPPIAALACLVASGFAPGALDAAQEGPPPPSAPAPGPVETEPCWSFELSGFTVNPPEDEDAYSAAVVRADRDALHLEGRWNYEDRHTASIWAGWNLGWESEKERGLGVGVTPMVGVVFGDTDGFAPGLELSATWWMFELWNESEYLFDSHDRDDDFFYSWTELTASPLDWLRFGLVGQRTAAFETDRSIDRGLLLGVSFRKVSATAYWFNPDDPDDDYVTFALGFSF